MKTVILIFGITAISLLAWLFNYLSTGTITITTANKNSSITIQRTSQGKPFVKTGFNSISAVVGHGQYIATVKNGSQRSVQIIDFREGHKIFRYSINLGGLETVDPVAYQSAISLAVDNQLSYLDASNSYLFKIDSQNNITRFSSSQQLQTVKWADSSFGVGQDNDGRLYTVANGSVSPLNVPFSYNGAAVNFDVSESKQIYVSYGGDIYGDDPSGTLKKIFSAASPSPVVAAGTNQVAVAYETAGQSSPQKSSLVVVSSTGRVIRKDAGGAARRLAWTPGGQYLATINESSVVVYDSSLHQVATIPTSSFAGYIEGFTGYLWWQSDNKLLYASNNELWSYNITNQRVALLATMPPTNAITGLTVNGDKSYAYITTAGTETTSSEVIRRVGLSNQPILPLLQQFQGLFPIRLSDCYASLVNFAPSAVIVVEPFAGSSLAPQAYLQEAQAGLRLDGLDPSTFQFRLTNTAQ